VSKGSSGKTLSAGHHKAGSHWVLLIEDSTGREISDLGATERTQGGTLRNVSFSVQLRTKAQTQNPSNIQEDRTNLIINLFIYCSIGEG
jgi:hypothetical protein